MPQAEVRLKVVPATGARTVTVQHAATAGPAAQRRLQGAPCTRPLGSSAGRCAVAALALGALVCTILPGPRAGHRGATTGPALPGPPGSGAALM